MPRRTMSLKIVHFSASPLAGVPIRIVRALQRHSPHEVRLVELQRWDIFEHDVVFTENPELAIELAQAADIIHLHNYLDYEAQSFAPIDFGRLHQSGKLFVRQFSSHPAVVARGLHTTERELLASTIPSLVNAQFHERYYPRARVVPLIIPQNDPAYQPSADPATGIFFGPGLHWLPTSAWDERWNTKGVPETRALLDRVSQRTGAEIKFVSGQTSAQSLAAKRGASLVVDELVTGSFHTTSLEGLSVGKPVLAYVDPRVLRVVREIAGATDSPFVNVRLEEAFDVLVYLLEHPDEAGEIGRASRAWIENYWSDQRMVKHYLQAYADLMNDPSAVGRQPELSLADNSVRFHAIMLPDLQYAARARLLRPAPDRQNGNSSPATQAPAKSRRLADYLPRTIRRPLARVRRAATSIVQSLRGSGQS